MNNKVKTNVSFLRQKAEGQLKKAKSALKSVGMAETNRNVRLSESEAEKLKRELEVYQLELEAQSQELMLAISEAELAVEKYTQLYDFAPSGYFTLSKDGEIINLNLYGAELLGKYRLELQSFRLDSFISDDTKHLFEHFLEKIFESRIKESCEVTFLAKGQLPVDVLLTGIIAKDGESCLISAVDITMKQKQVTEEIEKSENRFHSIFNNVYDVYYQTSMEGIVRELSPSIKYFAEFSPTEIIGSMISDLFYNPDDLIAILHRITQTGELHDFELQIKTKTGKLKVASVNAWLISDSDGRPNQIEGSMRDITRRNQAEGEVRKLQKAIENSKASVVITDSEGNIEYANPYFSVLTGYSRDEYIGKNPRVLNSGYHSKEFYKDLWDTIRSGQTWEGEFYNKKKNGEHFWENSIISPIQNDRDEITHFVAIKTDITETKKITEELVKAKLHAEESDNLKTAFLNNMSHEIRTPFNAILGFLALLEDDSLSPLERIEFTRIINESANRLMKTINDIAEISQIQSGQIFVTEVMISLSQLIIDLINRFQTEIKNKNLKFLITNNLPVNLSHIYTDRIKLNTILNNLVSNAIKFTKEGSIELEICLKESSVKINNHLALSNNKRKRSPASSLHDIEFRIKDTGIGIPENKQKILFERFIQVDNSNTREFEGSGLGTSIAKAYVEMLGGAIGVESELGRGSVFYFTIPCHTESKENPLGKNDNLVQNNNMGTPLKVLIAEDDEASQMLLKYTIKPFTKEVLIARSGLEAIETCFNNPDIDLVLMDIRMPEMDGYSATKQIRQFNSVVIIIAQTAYALNSDKEKAIESGCNDHLSKPVQKEKLIAILRKYFKLNEYVN